MRPGCGAGRFARLFREGKKRGEGGEDAQRTHVREQSLVCEAITKIAGTSS